MVRARSLLRGICAAVVPAVMAFGATGAAAATLKVNTPIDSTSPGSGLCSLREAVRAVDSPGSSPGGCAPASFGTNTIVLGRGVYNLEAPNGELLVTPQVTHLTISGAGEAGTVIDATGLGDRALEVQAGASVVISNLTITGGHAAGGLPGAAGGGSTDGGAGGPGGNGGAILNDGTLNIIDSAVTGSVAGAGGTGGSAAGMVPGNPAATGGAGGRGGEGGAIFNSGDLTLNGATIAGNQAGDGGAGAPGGQGDGPIIGGSGGAGGSGGNGGGVANEGGDVQIIASTIRGNSGGAGGAGSTGGPGWCCVSPSVGGPGGGGGSGSDGGGVWSNGGTLSLTNTTIVSNAAGNAGAGGAGGPQVQAAGPGPGGAGGAGGSDGGVGIRGATNSTVRNATIVDNLVGKAGAGGSAGQGTPAAAAGADGQPGAGGGLGGEGRATVTVAGTLLALNAGGNCEGASVLDGGYNLSFSGGGCPASFATGDPNLGPLQNNGGPTQTISLEAGSAAIDKIPPAGPGCPGVDQRGVARPAPVRGNCDIGAYEVAAPEVVIQAIQAENTNSVAVHTMIVPNSGSGSVEVGYGRSRSLGRRTAAQKIGAAPAALSFTLKGLDLRRRTYYLQIVATTPDGDTVSAELRLTVPILASLRISPQAFRTTGRHKGATITYTDSRPAFTRFDVQRRRRGRWVTIDVFGHPRDHVGRNSLRWGGRLGAGRLGPGRYRLRAVARSGPITTGPAVTVGFTVAG